MALANPDESAFFTDDEEVLDAEYEARRENALENVEPPTIDALGRKLANLREQRRILDDEIHVVEDELVDAMQAEKAWEFTVEGVGTLVRHGGTVRKEWDNDALFREIWARRITRKVDEATGEVESEAEAVLRHVKECARPSWRVTALKALQIEVDEFSTKTVGRSTVEIKS